MGGGQIKWAGAWLIVVGVIPLLGCEPFGFFEPVANGSEIAPQGVLTAYQRVTGDDADGDRLHWDALFDRSGYVYGTEPAAFLRDGVERLAAPLRVGKALDIAMGEGRNAVFLAKKGFKVEGVDYSDVALRKARKLAQQHHVTIEAINADLNHYRIPEGQYELIANINYLQRSLIPEIKKGLKKGGYVVFETHTVDQLRNVRGQTIPREYLLEKGELRDAFRDFEVVVYRETNDGVDAVASLIARRP